MIRSFFFFNDTATTEIYTLSLHDALPISAEWQKIERAGLDGVSFAWLGGEEPGQPHYYAVSGPTFMIEYDKTQDRSEEHTSELQSRQYLVCRLLLEKKNHRCPLHHSPLRS